MLLLTGSHESPEGGPRLLYLPNATGRRRLIPMVRGAGAATLSPGRLSTLYSQYSQTAAASGPAGNGIPFSRGVCNPIRALGSVRAGNRRSRSR